MQIFNKLVRDKIPQIIENNGEVCETRILNDEEYLNQLNIKLQEELQEYLESGDIEELADMAEVMRAILSVKGYSYDEFEIVRKNKVNKRGAFDNKVFLISTKQTTNK